MVEAARLLNPEIAFHRADMTALDHADESWAGVVAFYSIIHLPRTELAKTLREFRYSRFQWTWGPLRTKQTGLLRHYRRLMPPI